MSDDPTDEELAELERAVARYRGGAVPREADRRGPIAPEDEAAAAYDAGLAAMPRDQMIRTLARAIPEVYADAGCEGFVLTDDELNDHLDMRGHRLLSVAEAAALWREGLLVCSSAGMSRA